MATSAGFGCTVGVGVGFDEGLVGSSGGSDTGGFETSSGFGSFGVVSVVVSMAGVSGISLVSPGVSVPGSIGEVSGSGSFRVSVTCLGGGGLWRGDLGDLPDGRGVTVGLLAAGRLYGERLRSVSFSSSPPPPMTANKTMASTRMAPPRPAANRGTVFERSVRRRTMLDAVRSLPVVTPGPVEADTVVAAVELAPRGTPVGRFVAAGLVADVVPY